MAISKKQAELDVDKWLKSESAGHDLCGDFEFCAACKKELDNPCAAAYDAFYTPVKTAKKTASKSTAKAQKPSAEKSSVKIYAEKESTVTTRKMAVNKKAVTTPVDEPVKTTSRKRSKK